MTDMSTRYIGLDLAHPIVASSSPLTANIDSLIELESAGAAAIVLPSIFEEQLEQELDYLAGSGMGHLELTSEAHGGFLPELDFHDDTTEDQFTLISRAKDELSVPVIASLNGSTDGGWVHYATVVGDHGADAIELNIYDIATDVDVAGQQVEDRYLRLVESIRSEIDLPLAVKLSPFFSSPANMARRLVEAGVDGVVLFNRFYQPDIDLETLDVTTDLVLSTPAEMRLVLRWMAILSGRIPGSLGATTGVDTSVDVVKLILAGADVVMTTSALLRHGPQYLATLKQGTNRWFEDNGYDSVAQARGSVSHRNAADPSHFERANYMKTLTSYR